MKRFFATVAIATTIATTAVVSADTNYTYYPETRIATMYVDSIDSKNVDFLLKNDTECWGITYYMGVGDNMFGNWEIQKVVTPVYYHTYPLHGNNHFNPIEGCVAN